MDQLSPTELARLADYFARGLSPHETVLLERWIDERAERKQFVQRLRQSRLVGETYSQAAAVDVAARIETLSKTLADFRARDLGVESPEARASHVARKNASHRTPWIFSRTARYVAAVGAMVLLFVAGWQLLPERWNVTSPSVAMSVYATGKGERATITLPDGSTILLNVASRIVVPTNYAAGNRVVQLSGEALFTVAPLPGTPFTVVSGASTTRVLGTTFAVRHYETDTAAIVSVRDGKVAVGSVVLTAAQTTVITERGSSSVIPADARRFDFARGVLEFNYEPFPNAIPELNRWYDADIRLGDSTLVNQRIVGVFETGSLTDLISILKLTFNVRVVRDGKVLTLYKGL